MISLDTIAIFTWNYGSRFFLETAEGNFIWDDTDYGGSNTIKPFKGSYDDWCKAENIPYGRDKGQHTIGGYCGENVKILLDPGLTPC